MLRRHKYPFTKKHFFLQLLMVAMMIACQSFLARQKASAHYVNAWDAITHLNAANVGTTPGGVPEFRPYANGSACRTYVTRHPISNVGNVPTGNPRAVYQFHLDRDGNARAHNYEAGGWSDSRAGNCTHINPGAWNGNSVNLNDPIFANPVAGASLTRPLNVTLGQTGELPFSNTDPAWPYRDAWLKLIHDLRPDVSIGGFGVATASGYAVNGQPIWCGGIDIAPFNWGNIQWTGAFQGQCGGTNFIFDNSSQHWDVISGGGYTSGHYGAYTHGVMGPNGIGGHGRKWGNIGWDIPGMTRGVDGSVNDFSLNMAGAGAHDGVGTSGDGARWLTEFFRPHPYYTDVTTAWLTVEWDRDPPPQNYNLTPSVTSCDAATGLINYSVTNSDTGSVTANITRSYRIGSGATVTLPAVSAAIAGSGTWTGSVAAPLPGIGENMYADISVAPAAGVQGGAVTLASRTTSNISGGIACATRVGTPYVQAYRGDVTTGGFFGNAVTGSLNCDTANATGPLPSATEGTIATHHRLSGASQHMGSFSEQGVFARRSVDTAGGRHFTSRGRQVAPIGTIYDGKELTFANILSGGGATVGNFNNTRCMYDYYNAFNSQIPLTGTSIPSGSIAAGTINLNDATFANGGVFRLTHASPRISINPSDPNAGFNLGGGATNKRIILVSDGDVTIENNIFLHSGGESGNGTYTTGGSTTLPFFMLIVRGNINVSSNAHHLQGYYIAQPDAGTANGHFRDCTDGSGTPHILANLWSACGGSGASSQNDATSALLKQRNRLTISGGVVAQRLQLFRTAGDVMNPATNAGLDSRPYNSQAAEQFVGDPLLWFMPPISVPGATSTLDQLRDAAPLL